MSRDDLCWFHGKLTRENAEDLIKTESQENGTFLVRECNTASGDFVLTVFYQGEVCHYQIRRHGEDAFFSIDDKVKILHGLDTLVEFYQQAANGLVTKLTAHIKKDPPPNDSRSHGVTNLLHRATKENNHTVVSELLKSKYRNIDAKNQDGQTAVHLAALYCDEIILKSLLDAGVNVNCMDTSGNMPLHYACRSKPASFIRILIHDGRANVQGRNMKNGYVPLHEAAKHGNLDAVKELLMAHAPLLPRTSSGEFPIDLAKETQQEHVVAFLTSYKLPPSTTHEWQWYHGTLTRDEAVQTLLTFAAKMEKEQPVNSAEAGDEPATIAAVDSEVQAEADDIAASAEYVQKLTHETPSTASGCFLVRYSERKSAGSGYVLTLLWNNNVKNFLISQSSKYLYIDDGPYLPTLEHLIEHFMRFSDGLPVSLKYPVLPKPKPPLPLFSTMPRAAQKKSAPALLSPSADFGKTPLENLGRGTVSPEKHSQTLCTKKKHKENSVSVFHTLRLRSPKKSIIIEGMSSLRKHKLKSKRMNEGDDRSRNEEELQKTQSLLKKISFSTEFSNINAGETPAAGVDGFYNVPKNNAAVVNEAGEVCGEMRLYPIEIEEKTDAEVEYFTKSDVAIERERVTSPPSTTPLEDSAPNFVPNATGYIPTVDIRVFLDHGDFSKDTLEASAAELREFSNHPERLDSVISTASNESDIMRYFNRQTSSTSTITQNSEMVAQTKLNYFIPRDCLELDTIIGEGEFGSVYKGHLLSRNSETSGELRCSVAIKTLRDEHCRTNKQEFLREASVMIRLQHHCIVQLIGISKGVTLMMVQEIVPLGSMLHFMLEHRDKINPNYELKLWASQIACGMEYLESHHFVHRDLAARNILLASRNQAKISDFGLSRALGTGNDCYQASQGGKWPIKWYAPESFNNGLFSHASDVWSFGVTLWEMFSLGEAPYGDMRGVDAIQLIESGQRLPSPALCPPHVYEIMKSCWLYKPKDRPTFRYLTDFFAKDPDYQNIMELVKTEHIS